MMPGVALDPALLAIPTISSDERSVAQVIDVLSEIREGLHGEVGCRYYIVKDAALYLAKAGVYPTSDGIRDVLRRLGLLHVYSPEDLRRTMLEILTKAKELEQFSGVEFLIPTQISVVPNLHYARAPDLEEALGLTLSHAAISHKMMKPCFIRVSIADYFEVEEVQLTFEIDDICVLGEQCIDKCINGEIDLTVYRSREKLFEEVEPRLLWEAGDAKAVYWAILLAAWKTRRVSGCQAPRSNCERFVLGEEFLNSLKRWEAFGSGKFSSSTLDTCSRLIARHPKNETKRLYSSTSAKGGVEYVVRKEDGAEAWRTHISKDHEALRLLYWRRSDGSIELANIGSKSELLIM